MVDQIRSNLYKIEVPLPKNPLKALNSYIIKAEQRCLVIDTGFDLEVCQREMLSGLKSLDVDLSRTDFFITHSHADHLGLVASLATDTSTVYLNRKEAAVLEVENRWHKIYQIYLTHGFPQDELDKALANHPGRQYQIKRRLNFSLLSEGKTIEIGDYAFRCIETPGHSPGHTCLYDTDKKLLICGDHILFDITPNITFWLEMENALKEYLTSLEKVYTLEVDLALPGHRNMLGNHRKRITALQRHHQARLDEVLHALESGTKTAFQVAPFITWDVVYDSWELFPHSQKLFAVGETIAHLKYLEEEGAIERQVNGNIISFSLPQNPHAIR